MKLEHINVQLGTKQIGFKVREDSVGDHGVVQQIFQNLDYDVTSWVQGHHVMKYHTEQSRLRPSLIIDAGANIGASVVYFKNTYENAHVFAIEPEINNWQLLEINTANYTDKINFYGAISNADGVVQVLDPGLSDWGFRTQSQADAMVTPNQSTMVKSISPQTILHMPQFQAMTPLIFKIDIEGAERQLFEGDTAWMDKFAMIVIELHDWMLPYSGSAKNFLNAVAKYEFDFVHRGENIFLFNRRILSPDVLV